MATSDNRWDEVTAGKVVPGFPALPDSAYAPPRALCGDGPSPQSGRGLKVRILPDHEPKGDQ